MYCKTCAWRDASGHCLNEDKIMEGGGNEKPDDSLVYSYYEGGGFWVGERFGCVHHKPNVNTEEP